MEIIKALHIIVPLLLASTLHTTAEICAHGLQYLNAGLEACTNCTQCPTTEAVLRPCEIHADTVCGSISELLRERHQRHRHRHRIVWKYGDDIAAITTNSNLNEVISEETATPPIDSLIEAPFSSAETLIWDWQAIALTCAVFACILFFLAMALYSLHQAKQWRRLKDHFDADVEDLSARLSLMPATPTDSEKGEIPNGPINDTNYFNNRCVYLEQLLNVRKDNKIGTKNAKSNVYIEESTSSNSTNLKS